MSKWDPQKQDWVDHYDPPVPPNKSAVVPLAAFVGFILLAAVVALVYGALTVGEGPEAEAPPNRALPPSPTVAPHGDLGLTEKGADDAAFTVLYGYLNGGPEQASFIVQDIQQRTGCAVIRGKVGTIAGVRAEYERETKRLERNYGPMLGSALMDGVAINLVFECGGEG